MGSIGNELLLLCPSFLRRLYYPFGKQDGDEEKGGKGGGSDTGGMDDLEMKGLLLRAVIGKNMADGTGCCG